MLCAVSAGNSMIEPLLIRLRSFSGSARCRSAAPSATCRCARGGACPLRACWVNFAQASGVGCWPRNFRSPSPQPPQEITAATRRSAPPGERPRPPRRSCCRPARFFAGIDFRARGKIRKRVARVGDLIETDDSPVLAFALAAAAKIDTQRDVSPLGELFRDDGLALAVFVAAETVQDYKRRPALDRVYGRPVYRSNRQFSNRPIEMKFFLPLP